MRWNERQRVIRVMTDEELVGEIAFGNEEALATLYHRHAGWLCGRLWTATQSRELAEEVLQDTFVAVWRSAASFRGDGEVGAWLWGIARRRLVSAARAENDAKSSFHPYGTPEEAWRRLTIPRTRWSPLMTPVVSAERSRSSLTTSESPSKLSTSTACQSPRQRRLLRSSPGR